MDSKPMKFKGGDIVYTVFRDVGDICLGKAENGGKIMAKNKSEKKVAKKADSNPEQPYAVELELLKVAHAAFLAKAWKCYEDPIFVCSMMHTVHQAMMDLEHDFLNARATEKANGKKRDS